MNFVTGTPDTLPAGLLFDMAHYRYRVFVEKLGWKLACRGRLELDQFDRRDTLYVLASGEDFGLRGMARLLPTDGPYLLADVFPQLLGKHHPPRSAGVWELSRFAAIDPDAAFQDVPCFGPSHDALALLDAAMTAAACAGAHTLVTVSPLGIERILRRAGIAAGRLAPPINLGAQQLLACHIEIAPSLRRNRRAPSHAPV